MVIVIVKRYVDSYHYTYYGDTNSYLKLITSLLAPAIMVSRNHLSFEYNIIIYKPWFTTWRTKSLSSRVGLFKICHCNYHSRWQFDLYQFPIRYLPVSRSTPVYIKRYRSTGVTALNCSAMWVIVLASLVALATATNCEWIGGYVFSYFALSYAFNADTDLTPSTFRNSRGKSRDTITATLSSLVAPKVVVMTTYGTIIYDKVVINATLGCAVAWQLDSLGRQMLRI